MQPKPSFVDCAGRRIAVRKRDGRAPTLMFLSGYGSDMDGFKALALDAYAEGEGIGMVRFDYSGTGLSGGEFDDGTLDRWLEEAVQVADRMSDGPLVVIGSSMGGWIALHLALQRPERVQALVEIAAAPDFTEWGFTDAARATLRKPGEPRQMTEDFRPTRALWESGQKMLLLGGEIAIDCPVRLVHGADDRQVPPEVGQRLFARLRSADVQLKLIKGGGHRLSEPREIGAILRSVAELLEPSE